MPIKDVLRNCMMFADGFGKAGQVAELELPKLTLKMEELRAGGMDGVEEIDLGLEKMEASFTLNSFDPQVLKLFGVGPGNDKSFTFRGTLASEDGDENGVLVNMRGMLKETDPGSWKPGELAELKGTIAVKYYKLTIGGEVIHEIDPIGMKRVINGTDALAQQRINLGLA